MPEPRTRCPYALLGVRPESPFREIQHVWRDRCRALRDAGAGKGAEAERAAREAIDALSAAFFEIRREKLGEDVGSGTREETAPPPAGPALSLEQTVRRAVGMAREVGAAMRAALASGAFRRTRAFARQMEGRPRKPPAASAAPAMRQPAAGARAMPVSTTAIPLGAYGAGRPRPGTDGPAGRPHAPGRGA